MKYKKSIAFLSTAILLAFSSVVHADSARQSKIKELDNQRSELAKKNGVTGYLGDGRWYSLVESENKVDTLKKQVEALKVLYSEKNTIKVSPAYVKALKDNFDDSKSEQERDQAEEILKSESAKLALQKNDFVTVGSDEAEVYDLDNLPKDVVIELNYFALDMINQVRRQMGTPELTLAQSSIDFASKLSAKVKEANRGISDWHYVKGINEVAREYGLPISSKEDEEKEYGYQYYENGAGTNHRLKEATKAQLKRTIYDAILEFMYNGYEYYHAQSIAGVNWGKPNNVDYFGLSMFLLKDGTQMSFITVSDKQISKSTKNNFSTKTPVNTTESNRKSTLGKKEKELEVEKGKLEKLNISYKEYEKISKEIDKLNEEEEKEKEKERKAKEALKEKKGWIREGNDWYFYKNNQPLKNTWQGSYYLKSDGKMAVSEWVYDSYYKAWYYLKSDGSYSRSAWQGSYYLKSNGKMAESEWIYDSSYQAWYYLKSNGVYANSAWQGSYYLKSNGKMAKSEWIYDNYYQAWFYLKSNGIYARSERVQGYWVDSIGRWK